MGVLQDLNVLPALLRQSFIPVKTQSWGFTGGISGPGPGDQDTRKQEAEKATLRRQWAEKKRLSPQSLGHAAHDHKMLTAAQAFL